MEESVARPNEKAVWLDTSKVAPATRLTLDEASEPAPPSVSVPA